MMHRSEMLVLSDPYKWASDVSLTCYPSTRAHLNCCTPTLKLKSAESNGGKQLQSVLLFFFLSTKTSKYASVVNLTLIITHRHSLSVKFLCCLLNFRCSFRIIFTLKSFFNLFKRDYSVFFFYL